MEEKEKMLERYFKLKDELDSLSIKIGDFEKESRIAEKKQYVEKFYKEAYDGIDIDYKSVYFIYGVEENGDYLKSLSVHLNGEDCSIEQKEYINIIDSDGNVGYIEITKEEFMKVYASVQNLIADKLQKA